MGSAHTAHLVKNAQPHDRQFSRSHEDPLIARDGVCEQLLGPEPECDFARGGLGAVAAVDEVVLLADREITPHGAGRGGDAVGGAEEGADDRDRFVPFQDAHDDGTARDELEQTFEERLSMMFGVVLLAERAVDWRSFRATSRRPLASNR